MSSSAIFATFETPQAANHAVHAVITLGVDPSALSLILAEGHPVVVVDRPAAEPYVRQHSGLGANDPFGNRMRDTPLGVVAPSIPNMDVAEVDANHPTAPHLTDRAHEHLDEIVQEPIASIATVMISGFGSIVGGGPLAETARRRSEEPRESASEHLAELLADQGIAEDDLSGFREAFEQGGAVLAVQTSDPSTITKSLRQHQAIDIRVYPLLPLSPTESTSVH